MQLAKFDYTVYHVPGKQLFTADALSRAPIPETIEDPLQEEVESFVEAITQMSLPAIPQRLGSTEKLMSKMQCAPKFDNIVRQSATEKVYILGNFSILQIKGQSHCM